MEEEEEETSAPAVPPPSVRVGEPLFDSFTYHSVDAAVSEDVKGKGKEEVIEGDWMIGVDEAGRGPVLGPQVYGIAFCRLEYSEEMRSLGFADSKTLTADKREELLDVIMEKDSKINWATTVMSPHDLSRGMLKRTPYNLNAQSHDTTINLITGVIQRGYNVKEVYVDTVGIASEYQKKLEGIFPSISFTVTSKADAIYPIVSAASICAKVTRDSVLDAWTFAESGFADKEGAREFGSGYPSDPKTKAWLENNVDPVFGFPNIVRFSWQTVKTILTKRAVEVKWDDEPSNIQKYFSGQPAASAKVPLWKDFALTSVSAF
ncbi:ribonuclease [Meredithblackwellia eburnea MCA 4105]